MIDVYRLSRNCIYEFSKDLTEDAASWKPAPNTKSMLEILFHLTDAERYWLFKLERPIPEPPREVTLQSTLEHLREMEQCLISQIEAADPEEITMLVPTDRGDLSLAWAFKRVTHHMHYHLGTLIYLRSMLQPDWDGNTPSALWSNAVDAFGALIPEK